MVFEHIYENVKNSNEFSEMMYSCVSIEGIFEKFDKNNACNFMIRKDGFTRNVLQKLSVKTQRQ